MHSETVTTGAMPRTRRYYRTELLIVLGLSLGQSAVYSIVNLAEKATRAPLASQTTALNPVLNEREFFDLLYQLLGIFFALVPVALVLFLMTSPGRSAFRKIGFTFSRPGIDFGLGFGLAAVIGAGTLGVYAAGRALGITTAVVPAALDQYWWTVPVLVLSALRHAVLEEVVIVGYLFDRLARLGWSTWAIIFTSALIRGSYHLYQGVGPGIGNFLMGLIFGYAYTRTRRVMPLVVAHALLDIAGFVGYALFGPAIGIGS
ncbi:CAAX amino terminal protease family protein [Arthrobacter crystallopoietes BAB-32]|uniref:CAAX amino terminal protease family protein n=1 Tax=Arthrobacter crystallopoietes BAB-32 TaxID=1246476 RepID=N1UXU8_9MICC|nr:CPBP family intramembrane glutamic endopeptidase [Arthrobacter crystallopoietes]EMY33870.1 CAAX amino terminal protease family protein [Arthrobacter crystallopoietes BAB-32]